MNKEKVTRQIDEIARISNYFFNESNPRTLYQCEDFAWTLLAALRKLEDEDS